MQPVIHFLGSSDAQEAQPLHPAIEAPEDDGEPLTSSEMRWIYAYTGVGCLIWAAFIWWVVS